MDLAADHDRISRSRRGKRDKRQAHYCGWRSLPLSLKRSKPQRHTSTRGAFQQQPACYDRREKDEGCALITMAAICPQTCSGCFRATGWGGKKGLTPTLERLPALGCIC